MQTFCIVIQWMSAICVIMHSATVHMHYYIKIWIFFNWRRLGERFFWSYSLVSLWLCLSLLANNLHNVFELICMRSLLAHKKQNHINSLTRKQWQPIPHHILYILAILSCLCVDLSCRLLLLWTMALEYKRTIDFKQFARRVSRFQFIFVSFFSSLNSISGLKGFCLNFRSK